MARYKKKLEDDIRCPLEYGLAIFGGKWKSRIICVLSANEKLRYVNAPKQGVVISSPMCVKLSENKFSGGTHERRKNNHMGRADPCLPE